MRAERVSWIPTVALLLLAGCGGDGEKQPEVLTGVLRAGGVQGVHFQTPTQSGLTDGNGSFSYVSGEEVAFSIGNVQLGAAPGAAEVSLFRLAGLTPPSTERALRRELNRMRTLETPLAHATNLQRFLLALDADGNPTNGIDVRNRAAALANANLDFATSLSAFSGDLEDLAPDLNNNINVAKSLMQLYRGAGVTVRGNFAVRQFRDLDGDGVEDSVLRGTFTPDGVYAGSEEDEGIDGTSEGSTTFGTDVMGRSISVVTLRDLTGDLLPDHRYTQTNSFDARGNLLRQTSLEEGGLLGVIHYERVFEASYDDHGRTLFADYQQQDSLNSALLARNSQTIVRDGRGNATRVTTEYSSPIIPLTYRYVEEHVFDSADRVRTTVLTYDGDSDGQVDSLHTLENLYDSAGRLENSFSQSDTDGDGDIDERQRVRIHYDRAGNLERELTESEGGTAGIVTARRERRRTYDAERRVLSDVSTLDSDADGDVDERNEQSYVYDSLGMLTSRDSGFRDFGSNTGFSSRVEVTYDANGAPLTERYVADFDGDGDIDIRESTRIEYETHDDALPRIITNYTSGSYADATAVAAF